MLLIGLETLLSLLAYVRLFFCSFHRFKELLIEYSVNFGVVSLNGSLIYWTACKEDTNT